MYNYIHHRLICSAELSLYLINCPLTPRPAHEKLIWLRTLIANNTGTQLMFISLFVYDRFAEHDDYRRAADYARLSWNSKHLTRNTKPEILRRTDRSQDSPMNPRFPSLPETTAQYPGLLIIPLLLLPFLGFSICSASRFQARFITG